MLEKSLMGRAVLAGALREHSFSDNLMILNKFKDFFSHFLTSYTLRPILSRSCFVIISSSSKHLSIAQIICFL